jgi:hypothetical protein
MACGRGRPRIRAPPANRLQTGPERVDYHSPETGLATATAGKDSGFTVQSHPFCRIFGPKTPFLGKMTLFGDL